MHPEITRQLADEHRRDMLTDAQNRRLARQLGPEPGTARHRQPLTYRLWRRLRPVTRPRLEPQV
jgi:hypothetical protein